MYEVASECLRVGSEGFHKAFVPFFNALKARVEAEHDAAYPRLAGELKICFEEGRRYVKIIRVDSQRSVYGFIDKTNGDVLKAASWKAPAKHARGNIYAEDNGLGCCGQYGVAYLR